MESVCRDMDLPNLSVERGEAAFYGPKADFVVADCIGREWQLGTVQLDYNLPSPQRFGLEYIGADNHPHQPVMIHRAPFGSFERFVGMLIEHFAGAFPLWLAPEQARVMVVSQKVEEYGRQVEQRLREAGLRVSGDYRAEKIGSKIRDAQLELVPYMLVLGGREAETGQVALRDRLEGDLGAMPLEAAIARLQEEIAAKTIRQVVRGSAGSGKVGEGDGYLVCHCWLVQPCCGQRQAGTAGQASSGTRSLWENWGDFSVGAVDLLRRLGHTRIENRRTRIGSRSVFCPQGSRGGLRLSNH